MPYSGHYFDRNAHAIIEDVDDTRLFVDLDLDVFYQIRRFNSCTLKARSGVLCIGKDFIIDLE